MENQNPAVESVPVVICGPDGGPLDLARQNTKAFEKSIEQGHLWVVTATDRVLPYTDERPVALEARGTWNLARLGSVTDRDSNADAPETTSKTKSAKPVAAHSSNERIGNVLAELAGVIEARKRDLPEGSYTTHLFTSGGEKIRKKLGEEAVELILAPDRERLVSEASDLIYHLLVLLAHEKISISEIADELESR